MELTIKKACEIVGCGSKGLGFTTKTGFSYGLPARKACKVGSRLAKQKNSTCYGCYATGGNYQYPSTRTAQDRRLKSVKKLTDPKSRALWVQAMVTLINKTAQKNPRNMWYFRWHDSGDLVSLDHFKAIVEVAKKTPDIKHWLPTKEVGIVKKFLKTKRFPSNLTVRLSAYYIDKPVNFGLNIPVALVYKNTEPKGHICQAILNHKGCLENNCRACWNRKVKAVYYKKHR